MLEKVSAPVVNRGVAGQISFGLLGSENPAFHGHAPKDWIG